MHFRPDKFMYARNPHEQNLHGFLITFGFPQSYMQKNGNTDGLKKQKIKGLFMTKSLFLDSRPCKKGEQPQEHEKEGFGKNKPCLYEKVIEKIQCSDGKPPFQRVPNFPFNP